VSDGGVSKEKSPPFSEGHDSARGHIAGGGRRGYGCDRLVALRRLEASVSTLSDKMREGDGGDTIEKRIKSAAEELRARFGNKEMWHHIDTSQPRGPSWGLIGPLRPAPPP